MRGASFGAVVVAVACLLADFAAAAITYTTLDHPQAGGWGTAAQAIHGTRIVGAYSDLLATQHGFLYDLATGAWTTLDPPGATRGASAYGVSAGRVAGEFLGPGGQTLSYLYDGTTWNTFAHPPTTHAGLDTFARGTDGTTVVGQYVDANGRHGFAYDGVTFSDVKFPGATTFPFDVDAGRIVGSYIGEGGQHGFVFDGVDWRTLDHPGERVFSTHLFGIDGTNIVGSYQASPTGHHHGFLYDGVSFIPVDFPGATQTTVYGIHGDRIVGTYFDAAGFQHGYVAIVPEPVGVGAAGLALWWLLSVRPHRRG